VSTSTGGSDAPDSSRPRRKVLAVVSGMVPGRIGALQPTAASGIAAHGEDVAYADTGVSTDDLAQTRMVRSRLKPPAP
jgi:hypothetical protein